MGNKYIIQYNVGYGSEYDVVEADTRDAAVKIAYEVWRQRSEEDADYSAEEWTEDLAEDYGL